MSLAAAVVKWLESTILDQEVEGSNISIGKDKITIGKHEINAVTSLLIKS